MGLYYSFFLPCLTAHKLAFFFSLQLDAFGSFHCVLSAAGSNLSSSTDSKIMRSSVQDDNFPSLILIHLRRHQGIGIIFSMR